MILQPPAVLLLGAPGAGKTDSLATLIEAGLETFVISTEPDGIASFIDSIGRRKLDINKAHWMSIMPASGDTSALRQMIDTISGQGYEDIQKIKNGVGKDRTRVPAMSFLDALNDFKCERTGQSYGSVFSWDDTRVMVWDSLSGLSMISWLLTVGYKPTAHQGEWNIAQNFVEQLLLKMGSDRRCFFAMTAHVEKELNEINGVQQLMASTLGRKLAPKIPRFFSEVVYAKRAVDALKGTATFSWSTADPTADLKNRALGIGASLPPTFVPVVQAYAQRKRIAGAIPTQAPAPTNIAASKQVMPVAPLTPASLQPKG